MLIFIVEDNTIYAKALEQYLKTRLPHPPEIHLFPVSELCEDQLHLKPDFVITDYYLNSDFYDATNGLDFIKQVRVKSPETRIILLSYRQRTEIISEALKAGARYIVKDDKAFEHVEEMIRETAYKNR